MTRYRKHLDGVPHVPDRILKKPCHKITEEDHQEVQRVIEAVKQRIMEAFQKGELHPSNR